MFEPYKICQCYQTFVPSTIKKLQLDFERQASDGFSGGGGYFHYDLTGDSVGLKVMCQRT